MAITETVTPIQKLERHSERLKEIVGVAVRYGLGDLFTSLPVPGVQGLLSTVADDELMKLPPEVRLRLAFTELGTTFIKAGQVLSTRVDMIGPEFAEELSKLQSDTPPDPPEVVAATIERELRRPICELFAEFEPEAFASASVAQVHRATLPTGELVAVKVRRTGVEAKVNADVEILSALAELGEAHSKTLEAWNAKGLVKEFRRTLLNDLDFRREMEHIDTFRRNFEYDDSVYFPATWPELSTRQVLTSEYLPGILGTESEALKTCGVDLNTFALRGATVFLNMIFRDGFYHADPHPGNLMLLPEGVVGILDSGMVGRIDDGLRQDLENLVSAITESDADTLASGLFAQATAPSEVKEDDLKSDLADILADSGGTLDEIDVAATLNEMFGVFRKYRIKLRPGLSSLLRTLVLLDGTARRLNPQFNLRAVLEPYQQEAVKRRLSPGGMMKRFQTSIVHWDRFLASLPKDLNSLMQKARTGGVKVQLEHRHLDSVVNRLVLGILTASLILGASMLWSTNAPPLVGGRSMLGGIGYCLAVALGWLMFRAITDSGKISPED